MLKFLKVFTFKLGSKPFGIWLAWLGFAYAAGTFFPKLRAFGGTLTLKDIAFQEAIATWLVLIATFIVFLRRRLAACLFLSMSMTLLFFHSMFHSEPVGMVIAVVSIIVLLPNRRWFDEKLPKFD